MAGSLPFRLRTIAAATVVIASGLIIYNAYQEIIMTTDAPPTALPVIKANKGEWRDRPENPGGIKIPGRDNTVFDVLNDNNDDPLALNGAKVSQEPKSIIDDAPGSEGFKMPELPPVQVESLYDIVDDLKEDKGENATLQKIEKSKPIETVKKEAAHQDKKQPDDKKKDIKKTTDPVVEVMSVEKEVVEPVLDTPQIPVAKPKNAPTIISEPETLSIQEKLNRAIVRAEGGDPDAPVPDNKPKVPSTAKKETANADKAFSLENLIGGLTGEKMERQPENPKRFWIQLASLPSKREAQQVYSNIAIQFPKVTSGMGVDYPQANLGARGTFTRVQIGPMLEKEARNRCALYTASANGGTCLVIER